MAGFRRTRVSCGVLPGQQCPLCAHDAPRHLVSVSETADVDFYMCLSCRHIWTVSRDGRNAIKHISARKPGGVDPEP